MTIPGFEAAQARYDSMLPEDPPIYLCGDTDVSNEDCEKHEDEECPMLPSDDEYDGPYDTWKEWEIDHDFD